MYLVILLLCSCEEDCMQRIIKKYTNVEQIRKKFEKKLNKQTNKKREESRPFLESHVLLYR
jgi:hypothetical protein